MCNTYPFSAYTQRHQLLLQFLAQLPLSDISCQRNITFSTSEVKVLLYSSLPERDVKFSETESEHGIIAPCQTRGGGWTGCVIAAKGTTARLAAHQTPYTSLNRRR